MTATIRPLSRDAKPALPLQTLPVATSTSTSTPTPPRPTPPPIVRKPKGPAPSVRKTPSAAPRPGTTLDGSWDRKLGSGRIEPDRILDLHGHTLDTAWSAIDMALERSIAEGDRVLLLVTGHYRSGEPPILRGRIRAAVGDWLAVSRHAAKIAAVRNAHPRHGGGGSLYLILRRAGSNSTFS